MQVRELPPDLQAGLMKDEVDAAALAEYNRRFIVHKQDASCLSVASGGQTSTVKAALCGSSQFQVP